MAHRPTAGSPFTSRRDTNATGGKVEDGYLHVVFGQPVAGTVTEAIDDRRLPDSWLETDDSTDE